MNGERHGHWVVMHGGGGGGSYVNGKKHGRWVEYNFSSKRRVRTYRYGERVK